MDLYKMDLYDEFKVLLILSLFGLFLDISKSKKLYNKCRRKKQFLAFLFVHHIISVFTLIGWLSSNKKVLIFYILVLITIFLHWRLNNGHCYSTDYINDLCKINIKFRDFYHFLRLKSHMETMCCSFALIALIRIRRM